MSNSPNSSRGCLAATAAPPCSPRFCWDGKMSAAAAGLLLVAAIPRSEPFGVSATLLIAIGVALLAGVGLIRWLLHQTHRLRAIAPAVLVADLG